MLVKHGDVRISKQMQSQDIHFDHMRPIASTTSIETSNFVCAIKVQKY